MKRILALALVLAMAMTLFAGCSSAKPEKKVEHIAAAPTTAPTTAPAPKAPAATEPAATEAPLPPQTEAAKNENYIEYVTGHWDTAVTKLGNTSTNLLLLDTPLHGVRQMDVYVNISMNAGTHCEDWILWGRVDGTVKEIGRFYLPGGDGETTTTFTFNPAINLDAVVVTPTANGGFSWSNAIGVGEIYLKDAPAAAPAKPIAPAAPQNTGDYIESVGGNWDTAPTKLGNISTSLFLLDTPLVGVKEMSMYVRIQMNAGTHCEDWILWGRSNGTVKEIGRFNLPGGDGETTVEFNFSTPVNMDAVVVTPTAAGGYSWSQAIALYNIYLA